MAGKRSRSFGVVLIKLQMKFTNKKAIVPVSLTYNCGMSFPIKLSILASLVRPLIPRRIFLVNDKQVFLLTSRSDFCRGKDMNSGANYFRFSLLSFMWDLSKETQDNIGCGNCP